MTKERRLGRGLEALLGRVPQSPSAAPTIPTNDDPYGGGTPTAYGPAPQLAPQPAVQPSALPLDTTSSPHEPSPSTQPSLSVHMPDDDRMSDGAMPDQGADHNAADLSPVASGQTHLDVLSIDANPFQPREDFGQEETRALVESIEAHGLLQPIVVRRVDDRYQLVAGERRLRAAIEAGWTEVPANIIEADDRETAELAIVENLQRKDLNPLEKAASFQRYLEQYGCTQEELASRLKIDRSTIANLIRLLELPEPVQNSLREGKITQGHARALLPLGEEREQIDFCRRVQNEGLNVRQTEALVQEMIDAADGPSFGVVGKDGRRKKSGRSQNDHIAALEQEFRAALGLKVRLAHNVRGRGKLTIQFRNHEEFERLREHICDPSIPAAREQVS